jgi:hypothetical protein
VKGSKCDPLGEPRRAQARRAGLDAGRASGDTGGAAIISWSQPMADDDDLTGAVCTAFIVMSNRKGVEVGIRNGAVIIRPLRYDPHDDRVHIGRSLRFEREQAAALIRALVDAHAAAANAE